MIHIEPDEIVKNKKCPFCGWVNNPDYAEDHVINYSCKICGLETSFIDPNNGFGLDELPDGLGEDDFEDVVMEAEKNALDQYGNEQYIPDGSVKDALHVLSVFSKINETCKSIFDDIVEFDDMSIFRLSKKQSVKELIKKIFTEDL